MTRESLIYNHTTVLLDSSKFVPMEVIGVSPCKQKKSQLLIRNAEKDGPLKKSKIGRNQKKAFLTIASCHSYGYFKHAYA